MHELERTIIELGEKLLHTVDMWFADEDVVTKDRGQDVPAKTFSGSLFAGKNSGKSGVRDAVSSGSADARKAGNPNVAASGRVNERSGKMNVAVSGRVNENPNMAASGRVNERSSAVMRRTGTLVRGIFVNSEPYNQNQDGYKFPFG